MKIIIQNVVREPSTLEIRRRNPGSVVPAPLIGGHRLPPRRSRTVETAVLDDRDFLTLAEMTRCGVLRVFSASPYQQITEDALRAMVKAPEQHTGGTEGPYDAYSLTNWKRQVDEEINMWKQDHNYIPVLPANVEFQQIGETVVAAEVATEVATEVVTGALADDVSPEPIAEPVPERTSRDELLELKNAELRTKLAELGGGNGTGLSKAQLVDAILERLA